MAVTWPKGKGFVLTLDALTAVLLLGAVLGVISYELAQPRQPSTLWKTNQDFLTSLEKAGVFLNVSRQGDSQAQQTLSTYLNALPANLNAAITMKTHSYKSGEKSFELKRTISVSKGAATGEEKTSTTRIFVDLKKRIFGVVELDTWYS